MIAHTLQARSGPEADGPDGPGHGGDLQRKVRVPPRQEEQQGRAQPLHAGPQVSVSLSLPPHMSY